MLNSQVTSGWQFLGNSYPQLLLMKINIILLNPNVLYVSPFHITIFQYFQMFVRWNCIWCMFVALKVTRPLYLFKLCGQRQKWLMTASCDI